jgi:hypothetical protein
MFGRVFADGCPARSVARRIQLRHAATTYVAHGWSVLAGSRLCGDRFSCGPGCTTESCHPISCHPAAGPAPRLRSVAAVEAVWQRSPYTVLLATGESFDVVDVPAYIGALAREAVRGPVAVTPIGRWMFFVRTGSPLRPELAAHSDVVLHGLNSWIPAPPVRSPRGRVRWVVSPRETEWGLPRAEAVQGALVGTLPAIDVTHPILRRAA